MLVVWMYLTVFCLYGVWGDSVSQHVIDDGMEGVYASIFLFPCGIMRAVDNQSVPVYP